MCGNADLSTLMMENLVTYVPILKRCTAASLARMRAREPHAQVTRAQDGALLCTRKLTKRTGDVTQFSRWLGARETDRREGLRGLDDRDCGQK